MHCASRGSRGVHWLSISGFAFGIIWLAAAPIMGQSSDDTIQKKLHRLSDSAKTAKDFGQIIDQCREALSDTLSEKDRTYVKSMASWALNRRCELRMELAGDLSDVGNAEQAARVRDEALADAIDAIEFDATRWRAFLNRGILFGQANLLPEALADFEAVCQLAPDQSLGWFNRAEVLFAQNSFESSIEFYSRALDIDSADQQALTGRGLAYCRLKKYDLALQDFEVVTKLRGNDLAAFINRGDAYLGLGRWKEAYDDYIRAAQIESHGIAAERTAWLLATCPESSMRQPDVALELAKHAITNNGRTVTQLETLAAAYAAHGEFDQAVQVQQEAISIATGNDSGRAERLALYQSKKPFIQIVHVVESGAMRTSTSEVEDEK